MRAKLWVKISSKGLQKNAKITQMLSEEVKIHTQDLEMDLIRAEYMIYLIHLKLKITRRTH